MAHLSGPRDKTEADDDVVYVDSAGYAHRTAEEAIEANLGLEGIWGTGAGCGQDAANVSRSGDDSDDSRSRS